MDRKTPYNRKGFTLAELLVVVAIIGILVAVSIPIFTSQAEKAKAAADMANVRAAKAAAVAAYLTDGLSGEQVYYYDAAAGTVTTDSTAASKITGYGKSTQAIKTKYNTNNYMGDGVPNDGTNANIIKITIVADGTQSAEWESESGGSGGSSSPLGEGTTWQSILDNSGKDGVSLPAGTLITDSTGTYLAFANSDYYSGNWQGKTLAELMSANSGRVEKITSDTTIYTSDNFLSNFDGKQVPAGTVVKLTDGSYLCLAQSYVANQWRLPSAGHDNWNSIK